MTEEELNKLPLGDRIKAKKKKGRRLKRPTPINNKARGYRLEKLIVDMAKKMGLEACRAWGSNGRAPGPLIRPVATTPPAATT